MPECCSSDSSPRQSSIAIGYHDKILDTIPLLGLGCGAPLNFANLEEGETVVDLGSIVVFATGSVLVDAKLGGY